LKLKEHMTFIECDHCGQQYYKGIFLQA